MHNIISIIVSKELPQRFQLQNICDMIKNFATIHDSDEMMEGGIEEFKN